MNNDNIIEFDDFLKVDIRVGTIVDVQDFPEARKPAYKLIVDFGEDIGKKKSSAQITLHYNKETPKLLFTKIHLSSFLQCAQCPLWVESGQYSIYLYTLSCI